MATISKRGDKYRVQIRRQGQAPVSRTFHHKKDAQAWAREMELKADRYDLPTNNKVLERSTLAELVERYRDTVSPQKEGTRSRKDRPQRVPAPSDLPQNDQGAPDG